MSVFVISVVLVLLEKKDKRPFTAAFILTPLKGALPICSTIGNFGTIQFVVMEYYKYFKECFAKF
jgi:hypothetical protein